MYVDCHTFREVLCSSLLPKNVKIKILKALLFLDTLYGYETLSLTLLEECTCILQVSKLLNFRLCICNRWKKFYTILLWYNYLWNGFRLFKNRIFSEISGSKTEEAKGDVDYRMISNFIICTYHPTGGKVARMGLRDMQK